MRKLKKLKTKSCVRLIHSLLFIFSLMIDSLIKQQTAWSRGSSKYQNQKKCTRSEISINLSFYMYIIPKIISIIPISIQVLIPDLIFPVYKIDREQS